MQRIILPEVRVVYVSRRGNLIFRNFRFLRYAFGELNNKPTVVFLKQFKIISSVLKICRPSLCFVLDIRSCAVVSNPIKRLISDVRLVIETMFFENITIISNSLSKRLYISHRSHIVPVGAEIISNDIKTFNEFNLLYVGTLENRNIEITIEGFRKFFEAFKSKINLSYTIVGTGANNEEQKLRNLVAHYKLEDVVTISGKILHNQLKDFFDKSNIGVSYIPLTKYYDCQPPTKTFEYLLSGMPVIATRSTENVKIINPNTGVLIGDKIEDFCEGLEALFKNRFLFNSKTIRDSNMKHKWGNIVMNNLKIYFDCISR